MRLALLLKSNRNQLYETNYNYKIQSFIYNQLTDTNYYYLHDYIKHPNKKNSDFHTDVKLIPFCFSSIFPYGNMKYGFRKNLIISSPENKFIQILYQKLKDIKFLKFGNSVFEILNCKTFKIRLDELKFTTQTPIIVRIPKNKYKNYTINLKRPYDYIFWRKNYPLELFLQQLNKNLEKKFCQYYNDWSFNDIFSSNSFVFKKQISQKIVIRKREQIIIGTMWDFWFNDLESLDDNNKIKNKKILKFLLDAGIGERNTLGFGFLNPIY